MTSLPVKQSYDVIIPLHGRVRIYNIHDPMNLVKASKWLSETIARSAIDRLKNEVSATFGGRVTVQGTKTGR